MFSIVSRVVSLACVAFIVGSFSARTGVVAVSSIYYNPSPNVPKAFTNWLLKIVYPLSESRVDADGHKFVDTFAGHGANGTLIIGKNVWKGADELLSAWVAVPKLLHSLEHFPSDVYWDGGSKYVVFGLVKYNQLDGVCSQKSYATQFIFDTWGRYDGHLVKYHDWTSVYGVPGDLDCNVTWDGAGNQPPSLFEIDVSPELKVPRSVAGDPLVHMHLGL
ncbi:hypothetical protein CTheo_3048 [Ceratobasidium theobromae]|uniref:Effector protein n=1 Tax=Ceratobasidium theobromae TaxID=1582974 RepID=A0A5N5QP07_9AGAM|nr:hypothetical protein CTheo_3048 [Ceratobasidium theobromae]